MNERLLPVIPVSVRKLDGGWQKLNILLDTGSPEGIVLKEATVVQHHIATNPQYIPLASIRAVLPANESISLEPYWIEWILETDLQQVQAQIVERHHFSGDMGTTLLLNRRITVEVVKDGAVTVDLVPEPTTVERIQSIVRKPKGKYLAGAYLPKPMRVPWVGMAIKDREGILRTLYANVDTGDTGWLSLPPCHVDALGLRMLGKCWVDTRKGEEEAGWGKAVIVWQGQLCTICFIQREELDRPIVGMKLLSDCRLTIDFDYLPPTVRISALRRSASSNKDFLQSFRDRLHLWSSRRRYGGD